MSLSPPIRRFSTSSKREEELINAYEAEEERIINILSRKLEQLREEKINLENTLEAESESHVNRLSRELSALRLAEHTTGGSGTHSPEAGRPPVFASGASTGALSAEMMLDAMRRENEDLRHRLVAMERDYIRVVRLNDMYREELIEHRARLGLSVDNLIGLSSAADPLSQPIRRRSTSNQPPSHSPLLHSHAARPASGSAARDSTPGGLPTPGGMPIPRPSSRIYRPTNHVPSESSTPLSHSPTSPASPYLSPLTSPSAVPHTHASATSAGTALTTPASSASLHATPPVPYAAPLGPGGTRILSYPSVPPPSLSSSFGSPTTAYHIPTAPPPPADVRASLRSNAPRGRGSSNGVYTNGARRMAESGNLASRSQSRERGTRVAETGSLLDRRQSSAGRSGMPPTLEDPSQTSAQADDQSPLSL